MSDKSEKKIDIDQTVKFLNRSFANAINKLPSKARDNVRGTPLYQLQVNFAYLIDDIQRGPVYIIPKLITQAHSLIDDVVALGNQEEGSKSE